MGYTNKPSIGMLPIVDIDKAMVIRGFLKGLKPKDIEKVTEIKDNATGAVLTPGIVDPAHIAVCAGQLNSNGTLDRGTVNNALNLNGRSSDEYLALEDKEVLDKVISTINKTHANEIQLLRDELYHLKAELVKTGHIEDTVVADGFIDGFKKSNLRYDDRTVSIESINGLELKQAENVFEKNDWLVVQKDVADINTNTLATVTKAEGNVIQLDIGSANLSEDDTKLYASLGEYNRGTYSFSKMSYGTPGTKENYTMLNDDSNVYKHKIDKNNTGYATVLRIPKRCAGFLTTLTVNGRSYGNPGALTAYVIKGSADYINELGKTDGLSKAKADGNLIATSAPVQTYSKSEEIVFNFKKLNYDPYDQTSSLYPEVNNEDYCFVIEASNVGQYDYWQIEFGHKKNTPSDLQTNNKSYRFNNKDLISTAEDSFSEMIDIDMLYMIKTRVKEDEDEVPYSVGLYSTLAPIELARPIVASRARLTMEVNKEGNFVTVGQGTIRSELDTIEFRQVEGGYAEQAVIGGGDNIIIGDTIAKAKTSTPNTVTIDKTVFINPSTPIYRCGYEAQVKTCLVEKDPVTGAPTVVSGSERIYPLELIAVIPSGRGVDSSISDRLIFEVDCDEIVDATGQPLYFNQAELQIKWNSFLSSNIIHTQAKKGNDYVGRIHSLSLAFDKTV